MALAMNSIFSNSQFYHSSFGVFTQDGIERVVLILTFIRTNLNFRKTGLKSVSAHNEVAPFNETSLYMTECAQFRSVRACWSMTNKQNSF